MNGPGATGRFPRGRIHETDEGELQFALGVTRDRTIILDFGKPVKWIGMAPNEARTLADMLRAKADEAER